MADTRLSILFELYYRGEASAEEAAAFHALVDSGEHDAELELLMKEKWQENDGRLFFDTMEQERMLVRILPPKAKVRSIHLFKRLLVAASLIGVLLVGYWFYHSSPTTKGGGATAALQQDVAPGGDKAVLTLANGQRIILDSSKGTVAKEGGVTVINLNGKLSYEQQDGKLEVSYNTISTPKGGQYQLVLVDGSKVWLNAASSLRFPTAFIGSIREVELSGEGYFEIAKDASKPFHVKALGQNVEVLGTHFNINAYDNELYTKTTLLEGSVKVKSEVGSRKSLVLKPGQQSTLRQAQGDMQLTEDADTEQAVAWKNGLMVFHNADAATILREIERWYNVDVEIKGELPKRSFYLDGSRKMKLSELLRGLEVNHIKFTIDGENRKLTVFP